MEDNCNVYYCVSASLRLALTHLNNALRYAEAGGSAFTAECNALQSIFDEVNALQSFQYTMYKQLTLEVSS